MQGTSGKIAVLGKGGREHALCWKLSESSWVFKIFAIPGNGGTESCKKTVNVNLRTNAIEEIVPYIKSQGISLVIVGPEDRLEQGIANALHKEGIMCFGPTVEAAIIEFDKKWAKEFMERHDIPTPRWHFFTNTTEAKQFIRRGTPYKQLVVKDIGLAAGKGVHVTNNAKEAEEAVDKVSKTRGIIIEERLEGEEVSVLAFSDGKNYKIMPPVQDHKRLLQGDKGPNTGGMGAYGPYHLNDAQMTFIEEIIRKTIAGMDSESRTFVGVIYAGLMITKQGIKVLEFNCRFGDPETEVLMPLLKSDLFCIIEGCCKGDLLARDCRWKWQSACIGIVIACEGYPERRFEVVEHQIVEGLENLESYHDVVCFHGNTYMSGHRVMAAGGRALIIVALDNALLKAALKATELCKLIQFEGSHFRADIGWKGVVRDIMQYGRTTYRQAGVDISDSDSVVRELEGSIQSTYEGSTSISPIGGFAALVDAKLSQYSRPVLVSGCDGVGTKLKIAQEYNYHNKIGQDLVAMCVNDILANGAKPLFFLDYYSCGRLDKPLFKTVINSIINACKVAECALVGGETAVMPGFYADNDYDLAGFAVGVIEQHKMLPKGVAVGDKVIYLSSSGVHSNGFSLVRKIIKDRFEKLSYPATFSRDGKTIGEELLIPTKIYVKEILPLIEKNLIKAFAHITGGGIIGNIGRVLPPNMKVELDGLAWNVPPVFAWLATIGNLSTNEMLRTFNCGVGGVVIVAPENASQVAELLDSNVIGEVMLKDSESEPSVVVNDFQTNLCDAMMPFVPLLLNPKRSSAKRVAVMISGTGSNLKALIESTMFDSHSPAEIVYVISSRPGVNGIKIAKEYKIPCEVVEVKGSVPSRYENYLVNTLMAQKIDIICLAGYMHILSNTLVDKYHGKMINIHPSLLPSFKGLNPQQQALKAGVRFTGCTVHFVENEVDSGGIIDQRVVPIRPDDTVQSLTERIKESEHELYPHALKLLAANKLEYHNDTKLVRILD